MTLCRLASVALVASTSTLVLAQSWNQAWYPTSTEGWGPSSYESRVFICENPVKKPKVAVVDDFVWTKVVKRVVWWGTPYTYSQLQYPFQITFYKNDPNGECKPNLDKFMTQCVQARAAPVGTDCRGRKIWRFIADLTWWLFAPAKEKLWIQIAEVDEKSIRPGYIDFKWAFHLRTPNYSSWDTCAALGHDPTPTLFNIADACTESRDMAFQLYP